MTYEPVKTHDLKDSILFSCHRITDLKNASDIGKVTADLWELFEGEQVRRDKRADRKYTLKQFVTNIAASLVNEKWLAIPMNRNAYTSGKQHWSRIYMKYADVNWIVGKLEEYGLIVKAGGFDGIITRLKPTQTLRKLYKATYEKSSFEYDIDTVPLIIVTRKEKKKIVETVIITTRATMKERERLKIYNRLLSDTEIIYQQIESVSEGEANREIRYDHIDSNKKNIQESTQSNRRDIDHNPLQYLDQPPSNSLTDNGLTPAENVPQPLGPNVVIRIYARGDEKLRYGGRLYAKGFENQTFQQLSQDARKSITLNGKQTVELDFAGLHIRMLYAREDIQFPPDKDPYRMVLPDSDARPLLKQLLLVLINCKSGKVGAIQAIQEHAKKLESKESVRARDLEFLSSYYQYEEHLYRIIEDFSRVHAEIASYFASDIGVHLQKQDSDIMMDVLSHFTERGILTLPIHDSVVIAKEHEEELWRVMDRAYQKHIDGFTCPIERK